MTAIALLNEWRNVAVCAVRVVSGRCRPLTVSRSRLAATCRPPPAMCRGCRRCSTGGRCASRSSTTPTRWVTTTPPRRPRPLPRTSPPSKTTSLRRHRRYFPPSTDGTTSGKPAGRPTCRLPGFADRRRWRHRRMRAATSTCMSRRPLKTLSRRYVITGHSVTSQTKTNRLGLWLFRRQRQLYFLCFVHEPIRYGCAVGLMLNTRSQNVDCRIQCVETEKAYL